VASVTAELPRDNKQTSIVSEANELAVQLLQILESRRDQLLDTIRLADGAMSLAEYLLELEPAQTGSLPAIIALSDESGGRYEGAIRMVDDAGRIRCIITLQAKRPHGGQTDERILAALPEANPNIVIIVRCPNRIEYVNPTGRRWLAGRGVDSSDELRLLFPAELRESVCGACAGSSREWSTHFEERDYDVKMTPLADNRRCMIAINDVTEFRNLAREHELFAEALQSAKTAMFVTDSDGNIEFVNRHFEQLYGFSGEEVAGKSPSVLNPGRAVYHELGYSDEDYDTLFSSMWHDITDPEIGFWEGELPNRAKNGRIVWVRLLVHAVRTNDDAAPNFLGFPVDISESRFRERQVRMEIFQAITELAELRDNETGFHIQRVGRIARLIAAELGLSRRFQEDILSFAPLHDIGKVGIPDEILLAPRKLTEQEFELMKRHAELGYDLLKDKPTMEVAAEIAYGHHEHWNGAGYPRGVSGDDIPIEARIVSVCDVYDALRSTRPYKRAWTHAAAREAITRARGSQFDPGVVDAFLAVEDQIIAIEEQLTDEAIA
jgi:PAS domain S-box-containing protein